MTRGERVRMARKTLGLTLEKFGAKIGLKKSSLSQVETGVNDLTESNIKAICREFNVDEKWLRDGVGSMFAESETFSLDDFAAQHNATALEKEIIKTYFEIDPVIRKQIVNHFKEKFMGAGGAPDSPEELEIMHPPVTGDENSNAG